MDATAERKIELTSPELAQLGAGALAYVKEIDAGVAIKLAGPLAKVPEGVKLFALYGADGTPMSISGTRAAAVASAIEHELLPMSLH